MDKSLANQTDEDCTFHAQCLSNHRTPSIYRYMYLYPASLCHCWLPGENKQLLSESLQ